MKKCILAPAYMAMCAAMLCPATAYADTPSVSASDNDDATGNVGDTFEIHGSDNRQNTTSGASDRNTSSSSGGPTRQATSAELNCQRIKRTFQNAMQGYMNGDVTWLGGSGHPGYGLTGSGNDIVSAGIVQIPWDVMQSFASMLDDFNLSFGADEYASAYNNNDLPSIALPSDDSVSELTQEEKELIKQKIAEKEGINVIGQAGIEFFFPITFPNYTGHQPYLLLQGTQGVFHGMDLPGITTFLNFLYPNLSYNDGVFGGFRQDIVNGGLSDSSQWNGRLQVLERFLNSNVMTDYCCATVIEDFHIASVERDYVTTEQNNSDLRHWRVVNRDTGEVVAEADTANPLHQFSFSTYDAGAYRVEEYWYTQRTTGMFVRYDICNYLVDSETKRILYFDERLVSNGSGGQIFIGAEGTMEMEPTGLSYNIRVNDLGEVEVEGDSIERVK